MQKIPNNLLAAIVMICLLTGCATPVGKLADDDIVWTSTNVATNYQQAYRNIKRSLDVCYEFAVESNLYTDIGEGEFNLYLKNVFGGNHGFVYGLIKLKKVGEETNVRIGIQTIYAKPIFAKSKTAETLINAANGSTTCN